MDKKRLAEEIRRDRATAGKSQTDLAREIGATRQAVSSWETGLYLPTEEFLDRLGFKVEYVRKL